MVDFKGFSIYVVDTKVGKGWDYVVLPDGRRVPVKPGKYLKPLSERPLKFGFEDLTEEIGERPDWDFNEPACEVVEEKGVVRKTVRLKCFYEAAYTVRLYFDGAPLYEFKPGRYGVEIVLTYTDWRPVIIGGIILTAAVILGAARRKG